jgi:hypothetical protein
MKIHKERESHEKNKDQLQSTEEQQANEFLEKNKKRD